MYNQNNIKIFVSTFGQKIMNIPNSIPVEVGADQRNNFKYKLRDNEGDNISNENIFYGELTGLYWIWKNYPLKKDDIIGFYHYNKAIHVSPRKIVKAFNDNYDFITLEPQYIRDHPNSFEVDSLLDLLKKEYPSYYDAWFSIYDRTAAGNACRPANMFITTYDQFNSYCEFLFGLLEKLRKIIGDEPEVDKYMRRYCAYFSERLLAVYIEANHCKTLGCHIRYNQWYLYYVRLITNKLKFIQSFKLYKFLKNKFGYHSSYLQKK